MLYVQESKKYIRYKIYIYYGRYFHCDTVCVVNITAEVLNQSRDRASSHDFCVGSG